MRFVIAAVLVLAMLVVACVRPTETRIDRSNVVLIERLAEIPSYWKEMPVLANPGEDDVGYSFDQDPDSCIGCTGSAWSTRGWTLDDLRVGYSRDGYPPPLRLDFHCRTGAPGSPFCAPNASFRRRPYQNGWIYVVTTAGGQIDTREWPAPDVAVGAFVRLPKGSTFPRTPWERWSGWRALAAFVAVAMLTVASIVRMRARDVAPPPAPPPSTIFRDRPMPEPESSHAWNLRLYAWVLLGMSGAAASLVCLTVW